MLLFTPGTAGGRPYPHPARYRAPTSPASGRDGGQGVGLAVIVVAHVAVAEQAAVVVVAIVIIIVVVAEPAAAFAIVVIVVVGVVGGVVVEDRQGVELGLGGVGQHQLVIAADVGIADHEVLEGDGDFLVIGGDDGPDAVAADQDIIDRADGLIAAV